MKGNQQLLDLKMPCTCSVQKEFEGNRSQPRGAVAHVALRNGRLTASGAVQRHVNASHGSVSLLMSL